MRARSLLLDLAYRSRTLSCYGFVCTAASEPPAVGASAPLASRSATPTLPTVIRCSLAPRRGFGLGSPRASKQRDAKPSASGAEWPAALSDAEASRSYLCSSVPGQRTGTACYTASFIRPVG